MFDEDNRGERLVRPCVTIRIFGPTGDELDSIVVEIPPIEHPFADTTAERDEGATK
jgi:hypothetical protein